PRTMTTCGLEGSRYVRSRRGRSRSLIKKTMSGGPYSRRVPVLGAHVSSSHGLHLAFERAAAMGAVAIQCHPTPPNYWGSPKLDDERVASLQEAFAQNGKPPFYFHDVSLINLAGDDVTMRQRYESTHSGSLAADDPLGIPGAIFHT